MGHRFESMDPLTQALGVDPENSPEVRRATHLAEQDFALLASLVRLRREQGISQSDLARQLGVTQATISSFEKMDNDPKLSSVRRYAHAVGALIYHSVERDEGQLTLPPDAWRAAGSPTTIPARRPNQPQQGEDPVAATTNGSQYIGRTTVDNAPRDAKRTDFATAA